MKIERKLLMGFLTVVLLNVIALGVVLRYQTKLFDSNMNRWINEKESDFLRLKEQDVRMLSSVLEVIIQDQVLKNVYLEKNREKLYDYAQPLFRSLKEKYGITHFYFILPDGHCFARVHNNIVYGDEIRRLTFQKARDTGQIASGLELGKTAFALRVVVPYYDDDTLIGYVELGEEINHFLSALKRDTNNEFLMLICKKWLNKNDWITSKMLAEERNNWDDLQQHVLVGDTRKKGEDLMNEFLSEEEIERIENDRTFLRKAYTKGRAFTFGDFGIKDVAGRRVGKVLMAIDGSKELIITRESRYRVLSLTIMLCFIGAAIGIFISYSISGPLKKLKNATIQLAAGGLDPKIEINSKDEIGDLAKSFMDMTEKLKATTVSRDYVDNVIASIADILVVVDSAGKIDRVNKVACDLLGYGEEEMIGKDITFLFPEEETPLRGAALKSTIEAGATVNQEINYRKKNGKTIPVLLSGAVMKDKEGGVTHVVCVAKDISEANKSKRAVEEKNRELELLNKELIDSEHALKNMFFDMKKTHDDLKNAQEQLIQSEKLASIGQLAAGIAHEINNPLGFISSNVATLEKYMNSLSEVLRASGALAIAVKQQDVEKAGKLEREIAELEDRLDIDYIMGDLDNLLRESREGLERIKKIVMDLKTFSRKDEMSRASADLNDVLEGVVNIVWNEIKYKAELEKEYGDLPPVECNSQRIGQVFINLLVNAAQAIEDKGTITLRTYLKNKNVCIEVADTGKGIPEEGITKIFEPFFTTKKAGEGTGLGLSISYEIIKNHGGDIRVESELGKGTKFTIMLPV